MVEIQTQKPFGWKVHWCNGVKMSPRVKGTLRWLIKGQEGNRAGCVKYESEFESQQR